MCVWGFHATVFWVGFQWEKVTRCDWETLQCDYSVDETRAHRTPPLTGHQRMKEREMERSTITPLSPFSRETRRKHTDFYNYYYCYYCFFLHLQLLLAKQPLILIADGGSNLFFSTATSQQQARKPNTSKPWTSCPRSTRP